MTLPSVPATPRKLPVWRTVGACYAMVVRNLGQLLRISWLWLLIMLPVYAAMFWLDWRWAIPIGQQEGGPDSHVTVASNIALPLTFIVELPFLASIAVAWHRLVLRQERVTGLVYFRLDRTVWLYVLYSFLFVLLVQGPAMSALSLMAPPSTFFLILVFLAVLVLALAIAIFVVPRLSLVLPAVAVGERLSLRQAWRMTRANTLRLALATFLCILPAAFLPMLTGLWWEWTAGTETRTSYVIGRLIDSVGYAVLIIFAVTLLSLAYRHFVPPQETGGETAA